MDQMLNGIIRLSLKHRSLVIALALGIIVYGAFLTSTISIDVLPDLDRPRVVILTECPGLAPEEVEVLLTQPIETALLGASRVEAVRSQSSQSMNVVYVEFGWNTEIRHARQIVMERLATLAMPPGIRPQMTPPTSIMGQIFHVGLSRGKGPMGGELVPVDKTGLLAERKWDKGRPILTVWQPKEIKDPQLWLKIPVENPIWNDLVNGRAVTFQMEGINHSIAFRTPLEERMDLRTTADWLIRPRLLKLPGIAEIIVMGGYKTQY